MSENINDENIDSQDVKNLLTLFMKQPRVLTEHLHGSFEQLIEQGIPESLTREDKIFHESIDNKNIIYHGFTFKNVRIKPPTTDDNNILYPYYARKHNLNYFATIIVNAEQFVEKKNFFTNEIERKIVAAEDNISIASIPMMVKSKYCNIIQKNNFKNECKYDPGGYFIVNGAEKVVLSIEKMADNDILVFRKKESTNEYYHTVHINSKKSEWSDSLQIINIKEKKNGIFIINSSQITDIPIFILFRALGLESDKDIIDNIINEENNIPMENLLRSNIFSCVDDEGEIIKSKEDAINYIILKLKRFRKLSQDESIAEIQKRMYLNNIFENQLLPHLGNNIPKKIKFLGLMMNKLLKTILGYNKVDDRDSFENKRIETPGPLIGQLFRQQLKKLLNEVSKIFKKKNQSDDNPINVINQIKPNVIEQGIKTALATGVWGMNKTKKGVAQALQRLSWILSLSYLRRIMSPSLDTSTSGVTSIRQVNNIQLNFVCCVETPEGQKIGTVKSLATMASITIQNSIQKDIILEILDKNDSIKQCYDIPSLEMNNYGKIFINGDWVGCIKEIYELYIELIKLQRNNVIDKFTTIIFDYEKREIIISSDSGRLIRPLIIVNNNKVAFSKQLKNDIKKYINSTDNYKGWKMILNKYKNLIEYHDPKSTKYLMVAETVEKLNKNYEVSIAPINKEKLTINRYDNIFVDFSHLEFPAWIMLGIIASSIPFANHNMGTKNIINYSQERQAIGLYLTSYLDRMDISQNLYYPQLPLVTTEGMKYNDMLNLPAGENAIVAIMSYTGYNQEDSIIMNKSAVDRGLFMVDSFKKYGSEIQKNPSTSQDDIFTIPDPVKVTGMNLGSNYGKLNDKGFIPEETELQPNDILIGKISPIKPTGNNNKIYKDSSVKFKSNVKGAVDRVHYGITNNDGYDVINMRVRIPRVPIMGDKFTNRHGQKGTVGILLDQKDMPFTESGIIPDIIMNPHAIPSRMTIGNLIECLSAKVGAVKGTFVDGTPFSNYDPTELPEILNKLGYSAYGTETMYCGFTGKKMEAKIFIGPTYYKRLKHMVLDKIHSRARGPRQALVRQPLEGRSRDGGLKIGEMEKDSMVALLLVSEELSSIQDDIAGLSLCTKKNNISVIKIWNTNNKNNNLNYLHNNILNIWGNEIIYISHLAENK